MTYLRTLRDDVPDTKRSWSIYADVTWAVPRNAKVTTLSSALGRVATAFSPSFVSDVLRCTLCDTRTVGDRIWSDRTGTALGMRTS